MHALQQRLLYAALRHPPVLKILLNLRPKKRRAQRRASDYRSEGRSAVIVGKV